MKKLQTLIVVLMMVLILGTLASSVFAAGEIPTAPNSLTLSADRIRPFSDDTPGYGNNIPETGYVIHNNSGYSTVFKIGEVVNGNLDKLDFRKALYCARFGVEFGTYRGSVAYEPQTYAKVGNLNTEAQNVIAFYSDPNEMNNNEIDEVKQVEIDNQNYSFRPYNAVLWLVDNMAQIKGDENYAATNEDIAQINSLLVKAGIGSLQSSELTIDDIDVIQQMALWYFTNYDGEFPGYNLETVFKITNDGQIPPFNEHTEYFDFSEIPETRRNNLKKLYEYLIKGAIKGSNKYGTGTERPENLENINPPVVEFNAQGNVRTETILGNQYDIIGPMTIAISGNEMADFSNVGFTTYINGSQVATNNATNGCYIVKANGTSFEILTPNNIVMENNTFYFARPHVNEIINSFKMDITYTYSKEYRTATLYKNTTTQGGQPVIYTENKVAEESDTKSVEFTNEQPDFALRKYITRVERNGQNVQIESRVPRLNSEDIAKIETNGTADYRHLKAPVEVMPGDIVEYTITVYNEGNVPGKVTKIVDHLPEGLELDVDKTNALANSKYTAAQSGTDITITINEDYSLAAFGTKIEEYSVQVVCKVSESLSQEADDKVLTNIAEITEFWTATGRQDRDSQVANANTSNLPNYWGKTGQNETTPDATNENSYYEGQQDDDDFEKVVIKGVNFDLSLRKFISSVKRGDNEILTELREPDYDVRPLKRGGKTANYTHPKIDKPVVVKNGDIITYTIRVYNEGDIDGYANIIVDHIPEGLEFLTDSEKNQKYLWGYKDKELKAISTTYWAKGQSHVGETKDGKMQAYDGGDELDYRDVEIEFKVVAPNTFDGNIVNIAEIASSVAVNENNEPLNVADRDSKKLVDLESYDLLTAPSNSTYQEDDDDYEVIQLRYFDLALRKFITAVNNDAITSRIPEARWNSDKEQVEYIHGKDPVLVSNADIVTYTIRVFNEGTIAGYAEEVADDIPVGLVYLPEHATNIEYRWKMVDANGNETNNVADAVRLETDYLSEAHGETMKENQSDENPNLIRPFDFERPVSNEEPYNPDFRDVKIAFQVDQSALEDPTSVIINHAQITDDSDDDEDSTPDQWNEGEDDQDEEAVRPRIFDLSLQKWVTHTVVTVDGETTVVETGFTPNVGHTEQEGRPNSENEPVAQVVIDKKKLDRTTVKFIYAIKVSNEGEIPGYATEITDYIPEGLMFVEEDNPMWEKLGEDRVITHALETDEIQPGESRILEIVFTWINNENNLGVKRNIAAITEDYNEDGDTPDVDSTPGNTDIPNYDREQEDDDDFALVVLTLKTGGEKTYIAITLLVLAIIATGTFFIKRYVIG